MRRWVALVLLGLALSNPAYFLFGSANYKTIGCPPVGTYRGWSANVDLVLKSIYGPCPSYFHKHVPLVPVSLLGFCGMIRNVACCAKVSHTYLRVGSPDPVPLTIVVGGAG